MTTQHTPGPWHVGQRGAHCRIYAGPESHAIARTYGPDLNGIGVCELTGPKNAADARLIAAAPELLEAVQRLMVWWADGPKKEDVEFVRAAIAKATGEQP